MIPEKIHYCWFGRGEKPKLARRCIESWKKFCPNYELIEWNEDNFNIDLNPYTRMCYDTKKYAFLTDYLRLLVINEQGGLYFDTDVEMIKPFDELLQYKAFFGFETKQYVNTGHGFGSEAGNPILQQMLKEYEPLLDGKHGTIGCPHLNTDALLKFGLQQDGSLQRLNDGIVFPSDYFNPYDDPTGILTKTANTYSIHWYGKSWMSKSSVIRSTLTKPLHRLQRWIEK